MKAKFRHISRCSWLSELEECSFVVALVWDCAKKSAVDAFTEHVRKAARYGYVWYRVSNLDREPSMRKAFRRVDDFAWFFREASLKVAGFGPPIECGTKLSTKVTEDVSINPRSANLLACDGCFRLMTIGKEPESNKMMAKEGSCFMTVCYCFQAKKMWAIGELFLRFRRRRHYSS
jgi:hypothetical protein